MAEPKTIKEKANNPATPPKNGATPVRPTTSRMGYSSYGRSDPLAEKIETEELQGGTAIDNTGRGVLRIRNPHFEINDKYATTAEIENEERLENGGLTDIEMERQVYYAEIAEERSEDFFEEFCAAQERNYFERTYSEDSLYKTGATQIGLDGKEYTAIYDKESGELMYYDDGEFSCINPEATVLGNTINNDLIDADQNYNINYKVDADGTVTERTAEEKQFQTALTRMDNEATKLPLQLNMVDRIIEDVSRQTPAANDPSFSSAAEPPISSPVKASTAFNTSAAAPAEAEPAPEAAAANDPTYRVNGTSGPSASL